MKQVFILMAICFSSGFAFAQCGSGIQWKIVACCGSGYTTFPTCRGLGSGCDPSTGPVEQCSMHCYLLQPGQCSGALMDSEQNKASFLIEEIRSPKRQHTILAGCSRQDQDEIDRWMQRREASTRSPQ
jgi:hypothetical protein